MKFNKYQTYKNSGCIYKREVQNKYQTKATILYFECFLIERLINHCFQHLGHW